MFFSNDHYVHHVMYEFVLLLAIIVYFSYYFIFNFYGMPYNLLSMIHSLIHSHFFIFIQLFLSSFIQLFVAFINVLENSSLYRVTFMVNIYTPIIYMIMDCAMLPAVAIMHEKLIFN